MEEKVAEHGSPPKLGRIAYLATTLALFFPFAFMVANFAGALYGADDV